MKTLLSLTCLEGRDTPTAFVGLYGDTLAVALVGPNAHAAAIYRQGDLVRVDADFTTHAFAAADVKQVVVIGSPDASNFVRDDLPLPATIVGGEKVDAIVTAGPASVFGGGGADLIATPHESFVPPDPYDFVTRIPVFPLSNPLPVVVPSVTADQLSYVDTLFGPRTPHPTDAFGLVTA